jgi:CBS domain-containing protein
VLAAFNLLPAFPLDGGRVARSALWAWKKDLQKSTRIASALGVGFGYTLIALGIFSLFAGALVGGFWWILLGFFLSQAARSSYQNLMVQSGLSGEKVGRFMRGDPITVPADTHLDDLVENYIYKHHYRMYPVVQDGRTISCVSTRDVKRFDREEWPDHRVGEIATSCSTENTTSPDEDAMAALQKMQKNGNGRLIVIEKDGTLKGVVTLKDMLEYLSLKFDLEEHHHNRAA